MISIVFDKFIAALRNYEYGSRIPEALDKCMCITLLNYLINPYSNLRQNIKICERVDNKGVGLTSQDVMNSVLEYDKVPVKIQSYTKDQSYTNMTRKPSEPKDTRRAWSHDVVEDTISSTSEELYGLKTNDEGTFAMYGKFYSLKAFVLEEIYLGKLPRFFRVLSRNKKMDQSTKTDELSKNQNWR